jgi:hypothetical protein
LNRWGGQTFVEDFEATFKWMRMAGSYFLWLYFCMYGLLSLIFAVGTPPLCTCFAPYKLSLSLSLVQKISLITKKKEKRERIYLPWDLGLPWWLAFVYLLYHKSCFDEVFFSRISNAWVDAHCKREKLSLILFLLIQFA